MGSDQALQAAAVDGGSQLQCVPTIDAGVQWLLQRVDLGDCRHALEPFNGTGAISAALRAAGLAQVRTNDLASSRPADLHEDALQPGFYRRYAQKFGAPSVIVPSPCAWPVGLDRAMLTYDGCSSVAGWWLCLVCPAARWAGGVPGCWCSSPLPCGPGCSARGGRSRMG